MAAIPEIFDQPGAAFVFIRAGIKYPPIEKGWQTPEKGRTFAEATAHKGNVGARAGNGYIGLDQDVPEAFTRLELPTTTLWETRPGRVGMRFRCDDVTPDVLAKHGFNKSDQAQIYLYKGKAAIGEIKLERSYQVIPPSYKFIDLTTGKDVEPGKGGKRIDYKMIDTSPPAKISLAWLLAKLAELGVTFSEKDKPDLEANAAKLDSIKSNAAKKKIAITAKAKKFLGEALLAANAGHRNKTGFDLCSPEIISHWFQFYFL